MIYNSGNETPLPNVDLLTYLFDHPDARGGPDTPIHVEAYDPTYVITKGQCRALTKQVAHFLRHEYGIGAAGPSKDVVTCVATGQCALPCVFWGVVAAGGIYSGASAAGTPSDVAKQVTNGSSRLLVCTEDLREFGEAAVRAAGLSRRNLVLLKSYPVVELCSADGAAKCDFQHELDWVRVTDPVELESRVICIVYSSGSTGLPKGVQLSHTNMVAQAALPIPLNQPVFDRWASEGRPYELRTIAHLPTAHIAGIHEYFVRPVLLGGSAFWMSRFNLDDFLGYCKAFRVTFLVSVPPIWMAISKHPSVGDQLAHLRYSVSAAAPLSPETQAAANNKLADDAHLCQLWGLSETSGAATITLPDMKLAGGSVGFLLPNTTMRLIDDDGNDVEPGEPGECCLRGPLVTKGYFKNPEADRDAFTSDGWFKTGDIIRVENDQLFVVDRKKEMIKYKGMQVAPSELEGILIAHPAVVDAAVIGVAQDENELPRAYVVVVPSARGKLSAEELQEYVKQRVAAYKQLRGGVVLVDSVPRSPSGKLLRRQLKELQKKQARRARL